MKNKWLIGLVTGGVALSCVAVLGTSRAADHLDGPGATKDPAADITDVYAFMSPDTTDPAQLNNLVLIMNVHPLAGPTSTFSDKVDYTFAIRPITDPATLALGAAVDIKCHFDGAKMNCTGPNGLTASATVGKVEGAATDDMRVFAGLRSDPFFIDLEGFDAVFASGDPTKFTGKNTLAGANVLSIVVEVDGTKAFGGVGAITVAAQTTRTGN